MRTPFPCYFSPYCVYYVEIHHRDAVTFETECKKIKLQIGKTAILKIGGQVASSLRNLPPTHPNFPILTSTVREKWLAIRSQLGPFYTTSYRIDIEMVTHKINCKYL